MQQSLCVQQPQQAAGAGRRAQRPPAAWPGRLPQWRGSRQGVTCAARRSRTEVATPEASSQEEEAGGGGGGGGGGDPAAQPDQQHAQPPRLAGQQQPRRSRSQSPPPSSTRRLRSPPPSPQRRQGGPVERRSPGSPPPAGAAAGQAPAGQQEGTQLIFRLERRGEGWGEEILPHLVVEQRPLAKKKRAYSRPDPWKEGSLECYLVECGVPPADVDRVVTQAVAWRVTPGGRSLIDRRRRSRVERNVRLVVEHLELECGVPFGPRGIAAILARCPEVMLCKPTTNDRWDRRAVELAAFLLRHGHCNVPEDWPDNPELGLWVKRQRIARAAGQLSDERLSILQCMGFAFGEVAQLTEEWEHRFDQLVDWMLWHAENQQRFSWLGADWGARGGITARELALWTTLQREYRARGLLPGEALSRFEALGMQWEATDGTPAERDWISWFGRLLYVIERHNSRQPRPFAHARPKMGRPRGSRNGGGGGEPESGGDGEPEGPEGPEGAEEEGEAGEEEAEEGPEVEGGGGGERRGSAAVAAARQRLQADMAARRAALAAADLRSEPGLRFWLARQQRRWRRQALPQELGLMLQLAGAQLDPFTPLEWQALAHSAAALLQGSRVPLDPRTRQQLAAQQQQQQRRRAAAAAAAAALDSPVAAGEAEALAAAEVEQQAAAPPPPPSRGSTRLRVARWVQTQQALYAEGMLSTAQLRYMAFLGITWVLSEEVYGMSEPQWQERCAALAAAAPPPRGGELAAWLQHQRGLHALGWLPPRRRRALQALQVRLDTFDRCPADDEWDLRLGQLLAFRAEHGHCRLLLAGPPAAPPPPWRQQPEEEARWAPLAAWLAEQHRAAAAGRLPPPQASQLAAIGAAPPALQRRAAAQG